MSYELGWEDQQPGGRRRRRGRAGIKVYIDKNARLSVGQRDRFVQNDMMGAPGSRSRTRR